MRAVNQIPQSDKWNAGTTIHLHEWMTELIS